ncbi:respiratory nitrate reductase subunit gamma [Nocardia sp. NBC_01503]|uniref:respiratory nitrate reductase subunit gamma n=1 Tax=Nocardia sp. NBC_01503 TaxID=2975997 RepID=UPI002E7AFB8F|nr:respiratory nitrate reductase subunit gamma [Nocardia sp. NBC_01503]WTL30811.1 respiratory nitrate reductase subunit gamma [Nocardia sp. NBC_01503]
MMYVLWVFLPVAAVASCVAGHLWRFRRDRFLGYLYGPHVDTAQRFGSLAFRTGVPLLFVVRVTEVTVSGPHSRTGGGVSALLTVTQSVAIPLAAIGAGLILIPPLITAEARPRITPIDRMTLPVLVAALLSSVLVTFDPYSTDDRYRTAETLFTWIRSLVTLHPNAVVMQHAPIIYQARGLIVLLLIAMWPYTRLAGIFTVPLLRVLRRSAAVVRSWPIPVPRKRHPA